MIRARRRPVAVRACVASIALHAVLGAAAYGWVHGGEPPEHAFAARDAHRPALACDPPASSKGDEGAVIVVTAPRLREQW